MENLPISGTWLAGGAALGVVGACWSKITFLLSKINNAIFVTVTLDNDLICAMQGYLWKNFTALTFNSHTFTSLFEYVRPEKRRQLVAFELPGKQFFLFRKGWKFISVTSGTAEAASVGRSARSNLTIGFLRGTFNARVLVKEATRFYNAQVSQREEAQRARFRVNKIVGMHGKRHYSEDYYDDDEGFNPSSGDPKMVVVGSGRPVEWGLSELGELHQSSIEYMYLPKAINKYIEEAVRWRDNEDWYRSKGLPWKRGWLLVGRAGTGKTSFTRALAQELDLPIFSYDLASLSNQEIIREWEKMKTRVPCIALFEDFDCIFHDRENVAHKGDDDALTFECILNLIDGVENTDGIFSIITANDSSKISEAIGRETTDGTSRPGRVDRIIEFSLMASSERMKMAQRILSEYPERWDQTVSEGDGETGAQFQKRCSDLASDLYWEDSPKESSPPGLIS